MTDPSYRGQGVLFTVSHIGNVGINLEDDESAKPQVSAAVIRSLSPVVSNWRSALSLSDWLAQHGVPGISGVDTRWLTRKLRDGGTQKAALSTKGTSAKNYLKMARDWSGLDGRDMVKEVTCEESYHWVDDAGSKWVEDQNSDDRRTVVNRHESYPSSLTILESKKTSFVILSSLRRECDRCPCGCNCG